MAALQFRGTSVRWGSRACLVFVDILMVGVSLYSIHVFRLVMPILYTTCGTCVTYGRFEGKMHDEVENGYLKRKREGK